MTNSTDEELCTSLVELGIASCHGPDPDFGDAIFYQLIQDSTKITFIPSLDEENFVRSWEVAGAVIEKLDALAYAIDDGVTGQAIVVVFSEIEGCDGPELYPDKDNPLVRAIIETGTNSLMKQKAKK